MFYSLPYAGANSSKKVSHLGLAGDVIMSLLEVVKRPSSHHIFLDIFFSSYKLFTHLKKKGFFATGTIRENRTNDCPLKSKALSKQEKGTYDCAYDQSSKICLVRWYDNSVVTACSNACNVEPLSKLKRYNRKEKKYCYVNQPSVITQYNRFMGGAGLLHNNGSANYRCREKMVVLYVL